MVSHIHPASLVIYFLAVCNSFNTKYFKVLLIGLISQTLCVKLSLRVCNRYAVAALLVRLRDLCFKPAAVNCSVKPYTALFMAALRSRCGHYIFALWYLSIFFLSFFIHRLISAAADWMSTILPHMVWP